MMEKEKIQTVVQGEASESDEDNDVKADAFYVSLVHSVALFPKVCSWAIEFRSNLVLCKTVDVSSIGSNHQHFCKNQNLSKMLGLIERHSHALLKYNIVF